MSIRTRLLLYLYSTRNIVACAAALVGPALLFLGRTENPGNWVELKLMGTKSNRDAIGTRVVLTAGGQSYMREVNGGNGYSSQSTTRLHFGVGSASSVERVEIRWSSGLVQTLSPEQTATLLNKLTYLREGVGIVSGPGRMPGAGVVQR